MLCGGELIIFTKVFIIFREPMGEIRCLADSFESVQSFDQTSHVFAGAFKPCLESLWRVSRPSRLFECVNSFDQARHVFAGPLTVFIKLMASCEAYQTV